MAEKTGSKGGLLVGKSHKEGGIDIIVPEGKIEAEGGEYILTKGVSESKEKVGDIITPDMTKAEAASALNESEGGVKLAEKGTKIETASQGAKISNMENLYYLKVGNLVKDDHGNAYVIVSHSKEGVNIKRFDEFTGETKEVFILFSELISKLEAGKIKVLGCIYENDRDKLLFSKEVALIGAEHQIAEYGKKIDSLKKSHEDTMAGVEAMAAKGKKVDELKIIEKGRKDGWIMGEIGDYEFEAKVYEGGSRFGIDFGQISKLYIREKANTRKVILNYDRGWDVKPTKENEKYLNAIVEKYDISKEERNKVRKEEEGTTAAKGAKIDYDFEIHNKEEEIAKYSGISLDEYKKMHPGTKKELAKIYFENTAEWGTVTRKDGKKVKVHIPTKDDDKKAEGSQTLKRINKRGGSFTARFNAPTGGKKGSTTIDGAEVKTTTKDGKTYAKTIVFKADKMKRKEAIEFANKIASKI